MASAAPRQIIGGRSTKVGGTDKLAAGARLYRRDHAGLFNKPIRHVVCAGALGSVTVMVFNNFCDSYVSDNKYNNFQYILAV